ADRAPPAIHRFEVGLVEQPGIDLLRAIDEHDVGTHVGEQHARERARTDAGELDDLHTRKRSHSCAPRRRRSRHDRPRTLRCSEGGRSIPRLPAPAPQRGGPSFARRSASSRAKYVSIHQVTPAAANSSGTASGPPLTTMSYLSVRSIATRNATTSSTVMKSFIGSAGIGNTPSHPAARPIRPARPGQGAPTQIGSPAGTGVNAGGGPGRRRPSDAPAP